jgi:putative ABC transport system permease protein
MLATGRYADPLDYFGPNLPANQMLVRPAGTGTDDPGPAVPGGPGPADPGASSGEPSTAAPDGPTDQQRAAVSSIADRLGSGDVLPLDTTDATLVVDVAQGFVHYPGAIYVATPQVLRRYGIDPATVDPSALLLTGRPGLDRASGLRLLSRSNPHSPGCDPSECVAHPKIQHLRQLPTDASEPNLLITPHALAVLHLTARPAAWLVQTPQALSDVQITTARQRAVAGNLTIETKSAAPSLTELQNDATGAGTLVALAILAMTVGLIRSEAARELETLTANGAGRRIRRGITAATAGALGLTGALLGTAVGVLASLALFHQQLSVRLGHTPVLQLGLIAVGLPVAAAAAGWLMAGREPRRLAHQPIE